MQELVFHEPCQNDGFKKWAYQHPATTHNFILGTTKEGPSDPELEVHLEVLERREDFGSASWVTNPCLSHSPTGLVAVGVDAQLFDKVAGKLAESGDIDKARLEAREARFFL